MKRLLLTVCIVLMMCTMSAYAQRVVTQYGITNFKPGRGLSMTSLADQHAAGLRMITDSLRAHPNRLIYVHCVVDALTFDAPTKDDALNGGTSISRYLWAVQTLTQEGVPRNLIAPPFPDSDKKIGGDKRRILLEVVEFPRVVTPEEMKHYVDSVISALPKPVVMSPTTFQTSQFLSKVWLGVGIAYIPTERFVPFVQGQWGNERLRFMGEAGHSIYQQNRTFAGEELDVTYRYVLAGFAWRPLIYGKFDFIAAWQRSEVYSIYYGKYARKLEGPAVGLRLEIGKGLDNNRIALTGLWTPSEESLRGRDKAEWDYGRFYLGVSVFTGILGGK